MAFRDAGFYVNIRGEFQFDLRPYVFPPWAGDSSTMEQGRDDLEPSRGAAGGPGTVDLARLWR